MAPSMGDESGAVFVCKGFGPVVCATEHMVDSKSMLPQ